MPFLSFSFPLPRVCLNHEHDPGALKRRDDVETRSDLQGGPRSPLPNNWPPDRDNSLHMPTPPSDLTFWTLSQGSGAQLKRWIDEANSEAKKEKQGKTFKRVLTKTGKVGDLRQRLADYYGIDMSKQPTEPVKAGPPTRDKEIQARQWRHLRALGDEWKTDPRTFRLCQSQDNEPLTLHPQLQEGIRATLASSPSPQAAGLISNTQHPTQALVVQHAPPETVHAWIQAAQNGNIEALTALFQLQTVLNTTLPSPAFPHHSTSLLTPFQPLQRASTIPATIMAAPTPTPASPPAVVAGNSEADTIILESGEAEIHALERATNLREVIEQIERGDVQRIRERYGPQRGRSAHAMWPRIKVTVNRRERLYHQLTDPEEFAGDRDRFLDFFTTSQRSQRRKQGEDPVAETVPYRRIVEAIPHRNKDIREERKKSAYLDEAGSFSVQCWKDRWGDANDWEVWRLLEMEHY